MVNLSLFLVLLALEDSLSCEFEVTQNRETRWIWDQCKIEKSVSRETKYVQSKDSEQASP